MRISNVGMYVKDLEAARKFFEDYFGARVSSEYSEDNGFKEYIMIIGEERPKLEIMTKPEVVDTPKDPNRTGFAHICIKMDSKEDLDNVIDKIHAAGYKVFYEPATNGGKEIRAVTFEDNVLEVCY